jgi:hypothetical protein
VADTTDTELELNQLRRVAVCAYYLLTHFERGEAEPFWFTRAMTYGRLEDVRVDALTADALRNLEDALVHARPYLPPVCSHPAPVRKRK